MFNMQEVSERIMLGRKNAGLTQMELANILGVSFQAVSNWERGVSMPDISNLEPLATALGLTTDEILSDRKTTSIIRDGKLPEELTVDEFNAISPLLHPQQNEELIKRVKVTEGASNVNVESLCLTRNDIEKRVLESYEKGAISVFAVLLRCCSDDFISSLIDRAFDERNIAPFAVMVNRVTDRKRKELFDLAIEEEEATFVAVLSPYILRD